jgi:hypothetical protein
MLDMIGIGMIIPIIPVLFTDPSSPEFLLHGSRFPSICFRELSRLFSVSCFSCHGPGQVSDIYGRKRLLTLGVGILALPVLLSVSRSGRSPYFCEPGRRWVSWCFHRSGSIADVRTSRAGENFSLIGAAFGIGFILGRSSEGLS